MNTYTLPNHPDERPRLSEEDTAALWDAFKRGEAKHIGRSCDDPCKGSWEVVQHGDRYYIFLNDIGATEWAWEVSEEGSRNYCD